MKKIIFSKSDNNDYLIAVIQTKKPLEIIFNGSIDQLYIEVEEIEEKIFNKVTEMCGYNLSEEVAFNNFVKDFYDVDFLDPDSINQMSLIYGVETTYLNWDRLEVKQIRNIINFLEFGKKQKDFSFDNKTTDLSRQDSIWHHDSICFFVYKDRYEFICQAVGEIRVSLLEEDTDYTDKGSGRIVEFLEENNIFEDEDLRAHLEKGNIYYQNNNWFEISVYDQTKEKYVNDGEVVDLDDLFNLVDTIEEWI